MERRGTRRGENAPWRRRFLCDLLQYLLIIVLLILPGILGAFLPAWVPGPAEPLVIASGSPDYPALTPVADRREFIRKNDLNVTIRDYTTGAPATNDLFPGTADVSDAAKFMGIGGSYSSPGLRIIATTTQDDKVALIVWDDRGIRNHSDLKGVNYDQRVYRPYLETEKPCIIA